MTRARYAATALFSEQGNRRTPLWRATKIPLPLGHILIVDLGEVDRFINQFLDAACDESRRGILELLVPPMGWDSPEGYELRAGEIAQQLGLARSTTLEHLHLLLNLHLVSARKEGTVIYYRLHNHHLVQAFHELLRALETHYHTLASPSET